MDPVARGKRLPALRSEDVLKSTTEGGREVLVEEVDELASKDGIRDASSEEEGRFKSSRQLRSTKGGLVVDVVDELEVVEEEFGVVLLVETDHLQKKARLLLVGWERLLWIHDPSSKHVQNESTDSNA